MDYIWDYVEKRAYNNRTGRYKTKAQFEFILKNCKNKTGRILDIAGGAGRFAVPLMDYSKNITVLDINEKAIQILKERKKEINTICGDFLSTEIPGKYSLILCIEAMPYFEDWKGFFNKINSLMDTNGRYIFSYTNPDSWRFFLRKLKHLKGGYSKKYTEMNFENLNKLLRMCGLEIENMEGMNWIPLGVTSNSPLVTFFENVEKIVGLKKWHSQSPWLLISVKKKS
jgi:2-polyprenyl-3-methyl-5-hydroxy-6-metoxy-1,4-benzoquinol methylase